MENVPFWALTVAYSAHILEEYVLDWKTWAEKTSGLKMEWTEFLIANFAVIVLGICCSAVGCDCPVFAYLFVGLAAVNALFAHIGTTIVKRKFSPGLITSVFFFIPLCVWAYKIAYDRGILTVPFMLISLIGGFLIMSFPVILQMIKNKMGK
ncbi:HXXEE domain-containing protein [Prevotella sp. 10(H)]|uniref:HXXEE domain-containing protein n=1 Tax=Prevotella sp. 10(H) TaxID=1158294 RepID=UPI0004A6A878|nr:HXXEE domain-containing protein [Prevotella sp. 10(H)]